MTAPSPYHSHAPAQHPALGPRPSSLPGHDTHSAGALTYTVVSPGPPPLPAQAPLPPRLPMGSAPLLSAPVIRVLIAGIALITTVLGLTLTGPFGAAWDAYTARAIFAAVCAVAVIAGGATDHRGLSWPLQLYATVGLLLFWVIAVRPIAISNVGFLMTFGAGCAVLSAARNPHRPPWRLMFSAKAQRPPH